MRCPIQKGGDYFYKTVYEFFCQFTLRRLILSNATLATIHFIYSKESIKLGFNVRSSKFLKQILL